MAREILRLKEAKTLLEDIHDDLLHVIRSGFADWLRIREFVATLEGGPVNYKIPDQGRHHSRPYREICPGAIFGSGSDTGG